VDETLVHVRGFVDVPRRRLEGRVRGEAQHTRSSRRAPSATIGRTASGIGWPAITPAILIIRSTVGSKSVSTRPSQ